MPNLKNIVTAQKTLWLTVRRDFSLDDFDMPIFEMTAIFYRMADLIDEHGMGKGIRYRQGNLEKTKSLFYQ